MPNKKSVSKRRKCREKDVRKDVRKFVDLKVGDHFLFGGREHVRLPIVDVGEGVSSGYFNAAQIGSGQVSGFGPYVDIVKIYRQRDKRV